MTKPNPFRYFKTSPEIMRLAVMMYIRFPLSLRNVGDLLHERGIEIRHDTVRFRCNRFGPVAGSSAWHLAPAAMAPISGIEHDLSGHVRRVVVAEDKMGRSDP